MCLPPSLPPVRYSGLLWLDWRQVDNQFQIAGHVFTADIARYLSWWLGRCMLNEKLRDELRKPVMMIDYVILMFYLWLVLTLLKSVLSVNDAHMAKCQIWKQKPSCSLDIFCFSISIFNTGFFCWGKHKSGLRKLLVCSQVSNKLWWI